MQIDLVPYRPSAPPPVGAYAPLTVNSDFNNVFVQKIFMCETNSSYNINVKRQIDSTKETIFIWTFIFTSFIVLCASTTGFVCVKALMDDPPLSLTVPLIGIIVLMITLLLIAVYVYGTTIRMKMIIGNV